MYKVFVAFFGRFVFFYTIYLIVVGVALLVNLAFEKQTLKQVLQNFRTFFFAPILILTPNGRSKVAQAFRVTFTSANY